MRKQMGTIFVAIVATISVIFCLPVSASAAAVTLADDGAWSSDDWTDWLTTLGPGGTSTVNYAQSGGNPDTMLSVAHHINAGDGTTPAVFTHLVFDAETYTPSAAGPLLDIEFEIDMKWPGTGIGGMFLQWVIQQDGHIYTNNLGNLAPSSWTHYSSGQLTAANFARLDNTSLNPDFSITGSEMKFGLRLSNANTATGPAYDTADDYDNFRVSSVPEPTTIGMLLLGAIPVAAKAKRR